MSVDFSLTDVGYFIDSYGWKYTKQSDDELLIVFTGENSNTEFHLVLGISENWLAITIWPYLFPFPPEKELEALKEICKVNFDIKMARLAMKTSGEITLCIDLPLNNLTESGFHLALDLITYYADTLHPIFVKFWEKE